MSSGSRRYFLPVLALLPSALVLLTLAWFNREAPRFEIRETATGREVRVEGRWYLLVTSTRSRLLRFIPPDLNLDGGDIAHLNADGTVLLTNRVEAAKRSGWSGDGWPPHGD